MNKCKLMIYVLRILSTFIVISILVSINTLICKASDTISKQTMFGGNLQHLGAYDTNETANQGDLIWKFKTGGTTFSSPIVLNGVCYIGSEDNYLYAINISTGKCKWKFKTDGAVRSSATIKKNTAYITSMDGYLYSINISSGELVWKFKTNGEKVYDDWDYWTSSPAVVNNTVYFGSGDGNFYSIDATSGKELWHYSTNAIIHSSPAVNGNLVYFGDFSGHCYALDIKTHKLKWKFKTYGSPGDRPLGEITSSPTIYKGIVYIGATDHTLYALNAKTGKTVWYKSLKYGWVSTPAIKNGMVVVGKSGNYLVCGYDLLTGELKWKYDTGAFVLSSTTIVGTSVYVSSYNGLFFVLDLKTGKEKWVYKSDLFIKNANKFLKDDNTINSDLFYKYDKVSWLGKNLENAMIAELGASASTPAVCDGVVYFVGGDGTIYALK